MPRVRNRRPSAALRIALPVVAAALILVALVAALDRDRNSSPPVAQGPTAPAAEGPSAPVRPNVAIVWGGDVRAAARRLARASGVRRTTLIERGTALLRTTRTRSGRMVERTRSGFAVPLDVVAVDPRGYAAALDRPERRRVARLRRGQALLSETSARLRRAGAGSVLTLTSGRRLRVMGVLPDALAQSAELVVHRRDPRVAAEPRNVLAILSADFEGSTRSLARRAGRDARARTLVDRSQGLDGGPARPAELKARFGEPRVRLPYGDDWVVLDPAYVRRHIVSARVPILGTVSCNRAMVPALRAALRELERRRLAHLVDGRDYAGCYAPRRIRPGGPLSLHAWGLAIDLNARANPFGGRSRQDRRLVRTMQSHGFTWGGSWPSVRDPMHFEFRGR